MYSERYAYQCAYQLMGLFCDRLTLGSTAAIDCPTGQNKGRYCKEDLLFLLFLLSLHTPEYISWNIADFIT